MAGSCRSFPQDSRNSYQLYVVKRMIRGLGDETSFTYSQTLNMYAQHGYLIEPAVNENF